MSNFFRNLVENKKQKLIAIVYIFVLNANWNQVNYHNGTSACISKGHDCYSLITTSLIITIVFLLIVFMFKNKKQDYCNEKTQSQQKTSAQLLVEGLKKKTLDTK